MRHAALFALLLAACGDDDDVTDPTGVGGGGGAPPITCSATEVVADGACIKVGVENCGEGFTSDGHGGCDVVLPDAPCGPAEMALPGETQCHPLVECTGTRWGNAPLDANTEFVDANFVGTSDGSETSPWRTITEAVDIAAPGATVAIAAGTYPETVWAVRRLAIWGSCPTDVTIHGPAGEATLLILNSAATDSEVHDLAITSEYDGIVVSDVNVVLEHLWIHDTKGTVAIAAIDANGPAHAIVRDTLMESPHTLAALAAGSEMELDRTVIRDALPDGLGRAGVGIGAIVSPASALPSKVTMRRSIIDNMLGAGISLEGSEALVEDSVVRRVAPQMSDGADGEGLIAYNHPPSSQRSTLTVNRSLVESVHEAGVLASGSTLVLTDITVRDVALQEASPPNGIGIVAQDNGDRSQLTLERALVERAVTASVLLLNSDGTIDRTILRQSSESDGLVVFARSQLANGAVTRSRIEGQPRAGASAFGGVLSFEATTFDCNLFHIDVEPWNDVDASVSDVGQNHCGCGADEVDCKALSQNLAPPDVGF